MGERCEVLAASPSHDLAEHNEADVGIEELLAGLMELIKGPDFPTAAQILGVKGIHDMYRTGRGSITMRAVSPKRKGCLKSAPACTLGYPTFRF